MAFDPSLIPRVEFVSNLPATPGGWLRGIIRASGDLAIVSNTQVATSSDDGQTWVTTTLPGAVSYEYIAEFNGVLVAVGRDDADFKIFAATNNGAPWTLHGPLTSEGNSIKGVAASPNEVIVATSQAKTVIRSTDLVNWTAFQIPNEEVFQLNSLSWTGFNFFMYYQGNFGFPSGFLTSPDGVLWTAGTPGGGQLMVRSFLGRVISWPASGGSDMSSIDPLTGEGFTTQLDPPLFGALPGTILGTYGVVNGVLYSFSIYDGELSARGKHTIFEPTSELVDRVNITGIGPSNPNDVLSDNQKLFILFPQEIHRMVFDPPTVLNAPGVSNVFYGGHRVFTFELTSSAPTLRVELTGNGEIELYVRYGAPVNIDTDYLFDFVSYEPGANQSIAIEGPLTGTYFVFVTGGVVNGVIQSFTDAVLTITLDDFWTGFRNTIES